MCPETMRALNVSRQPRSKPERNWTTSVVATATHAPMKLIEKAKAAPTYGRQDRFSGATQKARFPRRRTLGGAVVADVRREAVDLVLGSSTDCEAADGAAGAQKGLDDGRRGAGRGPEADHDAEAPSAGARHPDGPHGREQKRVAVGRAAARRARPGRPTPVVVVVRRGEEAVVVAFGARRPRRRRRRRRLGAHCSSFVLACDACL